MRSKPQAENFLTPSVGHLYEREVGKLVDSDFKDLPGVRQEALVLGDLLLTSLSHFLSCTLPFLA